MMERTFIAVKPDGVQRGLVGTILKKFEEKGYKLVGLKLMQVSQELAQTHYGEHKGKPFFDGLVNFITSGPVVAFVLEGNDVVVTARKMIGVTKPSDSAIGTIRGDYGVDIGRNIIHGSDSPESAEREIALWFKPEELSDWTPTISTWIYE
jgi:nucleoside-diphosphate kinase